MREYGSIKNEGSLPMSDIKDQTTNFESQSLCPLSKMSEEDRNFVCWCKRCCIAVVAGTVLSFLIRFRLVPSLLLYDLPVWLYETLNWLIYGGVLGGVTGYAQSIMAANSLKMTLRRVAALSIGFSLLFLFEGTILGSIDEVLGAVGGHWLIGSGSGIVVGYSMNWIVWPIVCISSFLHGGLAGIIIGCISKIFRVEKGVGVEVGMACYFWSFSFGCIIGSLFISFTALGFKYCGFKDQSIYIFALASALYWWIAWCLLGVPNWRQKRTVSV